MISRYTLTRRELSILKGRLTRAIKTGDPRKVLAECTRAYGTFDAKGWPDCWTRWQIARDDARTQLAWDDGWFQSVTGRMTG